jgi:hypothetical protein
MITQHEQFIGAIHSKNRVKLKFYSKEDGTAVERICAPMDYGAGKKIKDGLPRYWVWDYTSDKGAHTLGLLDKQIVALDVLPDTFNPGEFVNWTPDWIVPRNW